MCNVDWSFFLWWLFIGDGLLLSGELWQLFVFSVFSVNLW